MTPLELFFILLKCKAGNILNVKFKSLITVRLTRVTVVCKLLDLGHAGLGHAELGQRDWDMRNWDSGTKTGATRTAGLGHAELGQRDWDRR